MFILTQDNERIVNLDNCDVIFVDKKNRVIAGLANTSNVAILGEYNNHDDAAFVVRRIFAQHEDYIMPGANFWQVKDDADD